jgi:cation transport ATPase
MLSEPKRKEIDHLTIKFVVGLIAVSLAPLTDLFAKSRITSISAAYYEGGWSQAILIGFLFAIAAFLVAYNGFSKTDMLLSKFAAAAALGVAMFPCECDTHAQVIPYVHYISAATMFLILVYFCYSFYRIARSKGHKEANRRACVYVACGIAIILSILTIAFDRLSGGILSSKIPRLIFYGEATGLVAFGVSWFTASRVLPGLTTRKERFSPFQ